MTVLLSHHAGEQARATPTAFLPPAAFQIFRKAAATGGARFMAASKATVCPLEGVPGLKASLEQAGFRVEVDPALAGMLLNRAETARQALHEASGRLEAVRRALAASGKRLRPYQEAGVTWLAPASRAILGDQQGLGKTLQLLAAAPAGAPMLVICPSVAKGVWSREAAWARPALAQCVLEGRGTFRWPQQGELVIANYDILPPTMSEIEEKVHGSGSDIKHGFSWETAGAVWAGCVAGTTLIADEAHMLKSNKTQRTQRFRELVACVAESGGRVWGATGTPLLNRPLELWNLLTTFRLHNEAFGNWLNFVTLFNAYKGKWGGYVWPEEGRSPDIGRRLKKVMLRRLRADVAPELPEKTRQDVAVEIDPAASRLCASIIEKLQARGIDVNAALVEAMRGRVNAPGFSELSAARKALATAKIPAMLELVEEFEEAGEPLLVFSAHRAPGEALAGRKGWAVILGGLTAAEKTRIEADFQAGRLKGIAGTIQAMGTALTLTAAANAVFVDLDWTPSLNEQAEDRMVRHGQTRGVVIRRLVARDFLDESVLEIISSKMGLISETVDAAATTTPAPRVDIEALEKLGRSC